MARTYRRQYPKTIVRAPRKRWNVTTDQYHSGNAQYGTSFAYAGTVAYNSDDNAAPTPVVLKCKNATLFGSLSVVNNTPAGDANPLFIMSYIMYVPEIIYTTLGNLDGAVNIFNYLQTLIDQHPEWIMSYKNVPIQYNGEVAERATCRWTQTTGVLKRNLRSGDRLMAFVTVRFIGAGAIYSEFYAESRCNTCAN